MKKIISLMLVMFVALCSIEGMALEAMSDEELGEVSAQGISEGAAPTGNETIDRVLQSVTVTEGQQLPSLVTSSLGFPQAQLAFNLLGLEAEVTAVGVVMPEQGITSNADGSFNVPVPKRVDVIHIQDLRPRGATTSMGDIGILGITNSTGAMTIRLH